MLYDSESCGMNGSETIVVVVLYLECLVRVLGPSTLNRIKERDKEERCSNRRNSVYQVWLHEEYG